MAGAGGDHVGERIASSDEVGRSRVAQVLDIDQCGDRIGCKRRADFVGAGNDTLIGGAGKDIYAVDSASDVVIEAVSAG
ncbi:hypothetical protein ACC666_35980, partial [Rhizobium johnstonii]